MTILAARCRLNAIEVLASRAILFVLLMLVAVRAFAGTVGLAWDPVASPLLAGYMVHQGPSAGNYTTHIDVGNTTTFTVTNLAEGSTYHFAVTAYDATHTESAFSNDVTWTVPFSPPVAQFSASATAGVAPLALNFINASTGTINTYAWNFGDGGTSNAQNPTHVYSTAGVYTVVLTVAGPGGSNTQTRTNYITVAAAPAAPVAQFTAGPTSGTAPLLVGFTNASTGTITSYAWNFGDGGTSSAQNPSHVYSTAGVYTVSLTVTGPAGSNTQTRSNYITASLVPAALAASFTADITSGSAPLPVNFTNTSTGNISSHIWDFGDGASSSVVNPAHTYASAGVYSVSLTVFGPGSKSHLMRSGYITVAAPPEPPVPPAAPVAQFTASSTSGTAPLTVNFANASTGNITTHAWDFGDGTTSGAQAPTHVYATAGVYTVSLTVSGPGGNNTQTRSNYISVVAAPVAPVAQFTANPTSGTAPLSVNFTSTSSGNVTNYAWDFGDGATSNAQSPSHVYTAAGVYTVRLTVAGPGGSNTQTRFSYIAVAAAPVAPVAQFTANPTSGTAPLTTNFTSTSTGTISTYAWSFGDGGTSNAANPTYTYATAGVYSVSLTVSGPGGSNTQTRFSYIAVAAAPVAPVAQFTASSTSGYAPLSVGFTSTSTGDIHTYAWDFGDGGTSSDASPTHVYATPGVYSVSLTVSGPGGSNTSTRTSYIDAWPAAPPGTVPRQPSSGAQR